MKLSLSTRIAERFSDKKKSTIRFEDFARLTQENNYHAICMRASVAGIQTSRQRVAEVRKIVDNLGLKISMVSGDFAIPENSESGPDALRNIRPHLDLAQAFGCDLLRICMKTEEDISWVQRASDEAAERGVRLAHQCHVSSLFETVQGALDVLHRVDRSNFGIIYEPANLHMCGQEYGTETLQAFRPYLYNVYLQNYLPDSNGKARIDTWVRGTVRFEHVPLHDERGLNWPEVFHGLEAIGYDGFVTVHQALAEIMKPAEAAQSSSEFLRSLQSFAAIDTPVSI